MESLLRRTIGETIRFETRLASGLKPCQINPGQLQDLILNLAIDPRDAMPAGGELLIETDNRRLEAEQVGEQEDVEPGLYVLLAVTDSGTGIADEILEHNFEPFFTTKGPDKGTVLGLSMVHGFVKQSGGHVKVHSREGEETTVEF